MTSGEQQHCSFLPEYVRVIITTDSHGRQRKIFIPAALDLDRPKRSRTTFEPFQVQTLETKFNESPFLNDEMRKLLAQTLGLTELQVKVWFQNRRTKERKMQLKRNDMFKI